MLHAKDAFELSRKHANSFEEINKIITDAANDGLTSVTYLIPLQIDTKKIIKKLIELGYTVSFNEKSFLTSIKISWKLRY